MEFLDGLSSAAVMLDWNNLEFKTTYRHAPGLSCFKNQADVLASKPTLQATCTKYQTIATCKFG